MPLMLRRGVNAEYERAEVGNKVYIGREQVYIISAIADAGTNIDVISVGTASKLQEMGFEYYKADGSESIMFGKTGAREAIRGYIRGAGLIEEVAVVRNIGDNLIGTHNLTAKGIDVVYTGKYVKLMHNGVEVLRGKKGKDNLCDIDLVQLLLLSAPGGASGEVKRHRGYHSSNIARQGPRHSAHAVRAATQLHERLKHVPYSTMALNIERGTWTGLQECITPALLRMLADKRSCVVCAIGRWKQGAYPGTGVHGYKLGECIWVDYLGKYSPKSMGCDGAFIVGESVTGRFKVYGVKSKVTVAEVIRRFMVYLLSCGLRPRYARHDDGSVENGEDFKEACATYGLQPVSRPAHMPEVDAERMVDVLKADIATIIECSPNLDAKDWLSAAQYSSDIRACNTTEGTRRVHPTMSALEILEGRAPNMSEFQEMGIGDIVVIRTPKSLRRIGIGRNQAGRILGMSGTPEIGTQVQVLDNNGLIQRRNHVQPVHIDQAQTQDVTITEEEGVTTITTPTNRPVTASDIMIRQRDIMDRRVDEENRIIRDITPAEARLQAGRELVAYQEESIDAIEEDQEINEAGRYVDKGGVVRRPMTRRQKAHGTEPGYFNEADEEPVEWERFVPIDDTDIGGNDDNDDNGSNEVEKNANDIRLFEEITGRTARSTFDTDEEKDEESVESNYSSDEESEVGGKRMHIPIHKAFKVRLERTAENPTNRMLERDLQMRELWRESDAREINGLVKSIFRLSNIETARLNGGITRHVTSRTIRRDKSKKTRISVDGRHEMRRGLFPDPEMTHSPAMDTELFRYTVMMSAYLGYSMSETDVKQAFSNSRSEDADVKWRIFISLSELECGVPGGAIYEVMGPHYGCADGGHVWYKILRRHILTMGFSVSQFNPCYFYRFINDEDIITVSVATDNCLKSFPDTVNGRQAEKDFEEGMAAKWECTHKAVAEDVLGALLTYNDDKSITVTQPNILGKIRAQFFEDGESVPVVMVPGFPPLSRVNNQIQSEETGELINPSEYKKLIGILGYARLTRNDVHVVLSERAEDCIEPHLLHYYGLKWLACYLLTSEDVGLTYHRGPEGVKAIHIVNWTAYGDASWASLRGGFSRYAALLINDMGHLPEGVMQAPTVAITKRETTIPAESASVAELGATVLAADYIMPVRGMSEEVAGVANEKTRHMRANGGAVPTTLRTPPTPLLCDNASLGIVIKRTTSKRQRNMRRVARLINYVKGLAIEEVLRHETVSATKQLANAMTKTFASPTINWREAEAIQGSHQAVTRMKIMSEEYGRAHRGSDFTYTL